MDYLTLFITINYLLILTTATTWTNKYHDTHRSNRIPTTLPGDAWRVNMTNIEYSSSAKGLVISPDGQLLFSILGRHTKMDYLTLFITINYLLILTTATTWTNKYHDTHRSNRIPTTLPGDAWRVNMTNIEYSSSAKGLVISPDGQLLFSILGRGFCYPPTMFVLDSLNGEVVDDPVEMICNTIITNVVFANGQAFWSTNRENKKSLLWSNGQVVEHIASISNAKTSLATYKDILVVNMQSRTKSLLAAYSTKTYKQLWSNFNGTNGEMSITDNGFLYIPNNNSQKILVLDVATGLEEFTYDIGFTITYISDILIPNVFIFHIIILTNRSEMLYILHKILIRRVET
eukprot:TRINITY_DN8056_c0_g1_i1.p1 TRINITY_DN8056_c0_g1~~TRINITY_DN8056_c0_g1_i1.p1  ORF type:complete len:356 (-),score=29.87 TRINITY_DN8056_c0_g1_i1:380-1417(-)